MSPHSSMASPAVSRLDGAGSSGPRDPASDSSAGDAVPFGPPESVRGDADSPRTSLEATIPDWPVPISTRDAWEPPDSSISPEPRGESSACSRTSRGPLPPRPITASESSQPSGSPSIRDASLTSPFPSGPVRSSAGREKSGSPPPAGTPPSPERAEWSADPAPFPPSMPSSRSARSCIASPSGRSRSPSMVIVPPRPPFRPRARPTTEIRRYARKSP